jgi:membrane protein
MCYDNHIKKEMDMEVKDKKKNNSLDKIKVFFQRIKTRLIDDWNKPFLLLFALPIVALALTSIKQIYQIILFPLYWLIPHDMYPYLNWIVSIIGTLAIISFIFGYLSNKYLKGTFQKERLDTKIFIILSYLPFLISEKKIVEELLLLLNSETRIDKITLLFTLLLGCLILQSAYVVYYRQIRRYLKIYYLIVDLIVLIVLYFIFTLIQLGENYIPGSMVDLVILLAIFIGFFIYHFLSNSFQTKVNLKVISKQTNKNVKTSFLYTPYLERPSESAENVDNTINVKYHSHILGNIISYSILLLFLINLIYLNLNFDNIFFNKLILIVAIYYLLLFFRLVISNMFVIEKDEFKLVMLIILITVILVFLILTMIKNDIKQSKINELNYASISLLLWILPKIVPTILDNLLSQMSYFKGVRTPKSLNYQAASGIANIYIYNLCLFLLILLPKDGNKIKKNMISTYVLNSISWSLIFTIVLIVLFTILFYYSKVLYYKIDKKYDISIDKGIGSFKFKVLKLKTPNNSENILKNSFKRSIKAEPSKLLIKRESKRDKNKFRIYANLISIIFSCTILLLLYKVNQTKPNDTFEIIKLSLPIVVPTFLRQIPVFLNLYLKLNHKTIKPTLKAHYIESVIDLNLFLIVAVLYVLYYLNYAPEYIVCLLAIIIGVHILSSTTLLLYQLGQEKVRIYIKNKF